MDTRQVFEHHARALGRGELDEILSDYAEGSVLIISNAIPHVWRQTRQFEARNTHVWRQTFPLALRVRGGPAAPSDD
jgi:hypothetical protein